MASGFKSNFELTVCFVLRKRLFFCSSDHLRSSKELEHGTRLSSKFSSIYVRIEITVLKPVMGIFFINFFFGFSARRK